jgi:Fic family protein
LVPNEGDVNKRTSRLLANLPLFGANLCPRTFLGVYELTRVELLRDLYLWAYERSTQEYLSIRQELPEPDPLRLAYREVVRETIREAVAHPQRDELDAIRHHIQAQVPAADRDNVEALVIEELRRLHEGVLARYGLRPSEYARWRAGRG